MSDEFDEEGSGALAKISQIIGWAYQRAIEGIPGVSSAKRFADEYLRSHFDPEGAIDSLIQWQVIQAGTRRIPVRSGRRFHASCCYRNKSASRAVSAATHGSSDRTYSRL